MKLKDSEGAPIPEDDAGNWDLVLLIFEEGPSLSLYIPDQFFCKGGEYSGYGVFCVSLYEVLSEYRKNMKIEDGGVYARGFAGWLRDYADAIERDAADMRKPIASIRNNS